MVLYGVMGSAAGAVNETGLIAHFDFEGDFNSSDDSIVGEYVIDSAAYYPFNGDAVDESINDNNGTVYGATLTDDHLGNENNAYSFDGIDDYIELMNESEKIAAFDGGNYTVSVWAKGTGPLYLLGGTGTKHSLQLIETTVDNKIRCRVFYSASYGANVIGESIIDTEEWNRYTLTCENGSDGYEISAYVNGKFEGNASIVGQHPLVAKDLVAGLRREQYVNYYMDGDISEVQIYSRPLSNDEVARTYKYSQNNKLSDPFIDGYYGEAVKFDGMTNYISVGDFGISGTSNASYIATFKIADSWNNVGQIFGGRWSTQQSFYITKDNILAGRQDNRAITSNNLVGLDHETRAYTFNYNGQYSNLVLYDKSVFETDYTFAGYDGFGAANQWIGYEKRLNSYFDGEISDLWVFNRTLSENEILNFYNYPISPENNSVINVTYPPLTNEIELSWNKILGVSKYKLEVAKDPLFYTTIRVIETTNSYAVLSLEDEKYYWRVTPYYTATGSYGLTSDVYNFEFIPTPLEYETPSIQGTVYQTVDGEQRGVVNANVYITNGTWSDNYLTTRTGYYFFKDIAIGSIYQIYATKEEYVDSSVYFLNTTGNVSIQDIALVPIEGEGQYYKKHYVRFIVTDRSLSQTYDSNIKVYEGEGSPALYDQDTGADGACGFWLDQRTRYRIETTYNGHTQTDYITPTDAEYYIFLEWVDTGDTFLPPNQFYQDVNVTITKNDDTGQVTIYYNDSLEETNSLKFQIGQVDNNGTFVLIEESDEFTENVKTHVFTVTNYVGQDYQVKVIVDHDSFGAVTKTYGVSFPGSNLPFGRGVAYLCVLILMIAGMQFSATDANSGAILICGLASIMWYMDIFEVFGSTINNLMGVGLGMAIFYSILKYINDKRMAEGL